MLLWEFNLGSVHGTLPIIFLSADDKWISRFYRTNQIQSFLTYHVQSIQLIIIDMFVTSFFRFTIFQTATTTATTTFFCYNMYDILLSRRKIPENICYNMRKNVYPVIFLFLWFAMNIGDCSCIDWLANFISRILFNRK